MPLFIQKPIFWNTKHYLAPSRVLGSSGFAEANGYGLDEYADGEGSRDNNSFC